MLFTLVAGMFIAYILFMRESAKPAKAQTDVMVVGCGLPKRGMGWFHSVQMLTVECPSAALNNIVEPWFLGGGADSKDGKEFAVFKDEWAAQGVGFHKSLDTVPPPTASSPRMALIAGRTGDNPKLLKDVINAGCKTVMLEKPGATTVKDLEGMATFAKDKGVDVYMGYNKNISSYITKALKAAKDVPGSTTKLVTLNDYKRDGLAECFERNSEGMLKNMAIHELALAATFFDMTAAGMKSVVVNKANSELATLGGKTDFVKVEFTMTNKAGKSLTIFADRCGGTTASAIVSDKTGKEVFTSTLPDDALAKEVAKKMKEQPDVMSYFWQQEADYRNLKEKCAAQALSGGGKGAPDGVATIQIAIEALKLAEYLTTECAKQLAAKK